MCAGSCLRRRAYDKPAHRIREKHGLQSAAQALVLFIERKGNRVTIFQLFTVFYGASLSVTDKVMLRNTEVNGPGLLLDAPISRSYTQ